MTVNECLFLRSATFYTGERKKMLKQSLDVKQMPVTNVKHLFHYTALCVGLYNFL